MNKKTFSQKMFAMSPVFFDEAHTKAAINGFIKNSSPGPDRITPVAIQNGCENVTKSKKQWFISNIAFAHRANVEFNMIHKIIADLEGAFDTVWKEGVIYKSGINNNLLSVFSSLLSGRYSRNLVNSHTNNWSQITLRVL